LAAEAALAAALRGVPGFSIEGRLSATNADPSETEQVGKVPWLSLPLLAAPRDALREGA
jgi:hypothetical protein